jgi:hypothetical protein
MVLLVSWPIFLSGLWSVKLEAKMTKPLFFMSLFLGLLVAEAALMLSFIPVTVWIASLFLATMAYVALGLMQHALNERLFTRTVYEYLGVGVFVLITTLLITPWR